MSAFFNHGFLNYDGLRASVEGKFNGFYAAFIASKKSLVAELQDVQRLINDYSVMPDGHPARNNLPSLLDQQTDLQAQIKSEQDAHDADVATRSAAHNAWEASKKNLDAQIAAIDVKLANANPLPASHPAVQAVPALQAQRADLVNQVTALGPDPGFDFS